MKPFLSISNDLPLSLQVSKSEAVFETNNTTYNESGYSYNQTGWTYGGSDRVQDAHLIKLYINQDKPKQFINDTDLLTLYIDKSKPTLISAKDQPTRVTSLITLYEGMPMGLLLTITYPSTTYAYV